MPHGHAWRHRRRTKLAGASAFEDSRHQNQIQGHGEEEGGEGYSFREFSSRDGELGMAGHGSHGYGSRSSVGSST